MGSQQSSTAGNDVRVVMDHLRRIVQHLRLGSREAETKTAMSAAQLFVLSKLSEGQPMSVNELARRTATHQSSVSVVASKLERLGLVKRERSATDARSIDVRITPRGRALLRKAPPTSQDLLIKSLQKLRPVDQRRLASLLGEWLAHARLDGSPAPMFFESRSVQKAKKNVPSRSRT